MIQIPKSEAVRQFDQNGQSDGKYKKMTNLTNHKIANKNLVIVGGGGHAKVVMSVLNLLGKKIEYILDDNPDLKGKCIEKIPVKGTTALLSEVYPSFVAIGNNSLRKKIAEKVSGVTWSTLIHPKAIIDKDVSIGVGTVVMAGAVIQAGATIGDHIIINSGVVVEHESSIQDFAHIAPNATVAGNCTMQEGAFLGIGSSMIEETRIGSWSVVGAGAAVISDIPPHCTAVGMPAKPLEIRGKNTFKWV